MDKKILQNKIRKLQKGEIESRKYTEKEIIEKINYYKSIQNIKSVESGRLSKKRWEYEIKRNTELSSSFKKCPDLGFLRLEYIMNYGL